MLGMFFLYEGQLFFSFLVFAALVVALLLEMPSSRGAGREPVPPSGLLGETEKKAFGGEHEFGYRLGLFLNFLGQLFGVFWGSFGKEPEKKKEEPKIVVELKK